MNHTAATNGWFATTSGTNVAAFYPQANAVSAGRVADGAYALPRLAEVAAPVDPMDWLRERVGEVVDRGALEFA